MTVSELIFSVGLRGLCRFPVFRFVIELTFGLSLSLLGGEICFEIALVGCRVVDATLPGYGLPMLGLSFICGVEALFAVLG